MHYVTHAALPQRPLFASKAQLSCACPLNPPPPQIHRLCGLHREIPLAACDNLTCFDGLCADSLTICGDRTCQDVTPPTLLRSHPGHDSSGVSLFTPVELVFVFNEPVNPAVNATALISVASTAPSVSNPQILLVTGIHRINTSAFRFTLNGQLQREGNQYTVSVQPSAFHDLAEPPLSSGAITFKFNATADSLPPILDLAASWPRPNSTVNASIDPLFGIRMIFNEPVRRVPGFSSGSAPVSVYDVADDAHTAVSGTVSEWFDGKVAHSTPIDYDMYYICSIPWWLFLSLSWVVTAIVGCDDTC